MNGFDRFPCFCPQETRSFLDQKNVNELILELNKCKVNNQQKNVDAPIYSVAENENENTQYTR